MRRPCCIVRSDTAAAVVLVGPHTPCDGPGRFWRPPRLRGDRFVTAQRQVVTALSQPRGLPSDGTGALPTPVVLPTAGHAAAPLQRTAGARPCAPRVGPPEETDHDDAYHH